MLIAVVAGLSLTWFGSMQMRAEERASSQLVFERSVQRATARIEGRFTDLSHRLQDVLGLFAASTRVDEEEFVAYWHAATARNDAPGLLGLGLALHMESESGPLTSIHYVAPRLGFGELLGRNLWADPIWRDVLQRSAQSDQIVLSEPVADDATGTAGTQFIALPLTRELLGGLAEDPAITGGWVIAFISTHELLTLDHADETGELAIDILDSGVNPPVMLRCADEGLHSDHEDCATHEIVEQRSILLADRPGIIRVRSTDAYESIVASGRPELAFTSGTLLTALVSVVMFLIVTARERAESIARRTIERAREIESQYRAAARASLDAFYVLRAVRDEEGRATDFEFVDVNDNGAAMASMERADMIGQRLCELLPVNRTHGFFEKYVHVMETGEVLEEEFEIHVDMINATWLHHQVVPIDDGVAIMSRNISERKGDEQALAQSEARFELAVAGSSDGLWDWRVGSDEVYYSPRFKELLGYEPGDFPDLFASWADTLHPGDRDRTMRAIRRHLDDNEAYDVEYRCRTKDGGYRWFRARGMAARDADGQPVRMAGNLTDITDEKNSKAELQRYAEDLLEAKTALESQATELATKSAELEESRSVAEQANEAKSEFLANMSHEIRTPMTAILGYADLLAEPGGDPALRSDHIATIRRNGEHLLAIINDILDLSKIEAGRMTVERVACSPWRVARDVEQLLRVRAEGKGIGFEVVHATPLPVEVATDPTRLRQILLNLAGNAIKFTEHGAVRVIVSFHQARSGASSELVFDVEDSGIGMSPEQLRRLFKPFTQADYSTTRRFGGTGLGLTISKRLAELMGGTIDVASVEGDGSTFRVVLQLDEDAQFEVTDDPDAAVVSPSDASVAPGSDRLTSRILLAEDGPDNQRLLSFHLRRAGASVDIAENGRLAVDMALEALEEGRAYDVILMDMQMPVLDGYGATKELRSRRYAGSIIGLTAHAMPGDRAKVIDAGCDEYLSKPIEKEALISACARASSTDEDRRAA